MRLSTGIGSTPPRLRRQLGLTIQSLTARIPGAFYVGLALLGLVWVVLGGEWYRRIVPIYDSLQYQIHAEQILRGYASRGWTGAAAALAEVLPSSPLHGLVLFLLAPFLPLSRLALYAYLIPFHLVSLGALFHFLHRRTRSLALALLGPLLYLATVPFGTLVLGIPDQRMDLAAAAFAILLWIAGIAWAEDPSSRRKAVGLGAAAALAMMHRVILVPLLAPSVVILVLFAVTNSAPQGGRWRHVLRQLGTALLTATIVVAPFLLFSGFRAFTYYAVSNADVGVLGPAEAAGFHARLLGHWTGPRAGALLALIVIAAAVARRLSLRYSLLVAGLTFSTLLALVFTGSRNPAVTQVFLAGLGFVPLALTGNEGRSFRAAPWLAILAMVLAAWNVHALAQAVNATDLSTRREVERVLLELAEWRDGRGARSPISGFVMRGGGPAAMASMARLDLGLELRTGVAWSHPISFGLPPREAEFSSAELDAAAARALEAAYERGGFLMLVEPSLADALQPKFGATFPFAHQLAARMSRMAMQDGRLADTGITATLEGMPFHFYWIRQ